MNVFLVTFSIGLILSLKLMSHVHREPKQIILLNYVFLLICEVKKLSKNTILLIIHKKN